uniref:NADH dehydrogenase subunit 6 n=1 Tax=Atrina pectinata TaxID=49198 RepID=L0EUB7_ATRPE|nr:NADH dehydrogenase subunit 6 [Atrina pectinata]AGA63945.1 NADH dehydrogenase subunit 6 [Atrina pectinata]UZT27163.1 NADH dehydrogenase subunit 6 [Atrina pectinata]
MTVWYLFLIPVVILGLYVVQSRQPLVLFLSVVMSTILLCSGLGLVGLKLKGYMGFMVYVGGLFVLFGYMISLISMDLEGSYALWGPAVGGVFLFLLWVYNVGEVKDISLDVNMGSEFGEFSAFLAVGLALILLVVMVAVVKISDLDKGCLRHGSKI